MMIEVWVRQMLLKAKRRLREEARPAADRFREARLGDFIIDRVKAFAEHIGGDAAAVQEKAVKSCLASEQKKIVTLVGDAHQYLQTALTSAYTADLFSYYKQQQFLILLRFLSYPYRGPGCLDSYVVPYQTAYERLGAMNVLDFGAGIPFGLISLAQSDPEAISSATIVDLDLIHTTLAEFILADLLPGRVNVIRTRDPNAVASLSRQFDFIYGKDVFEHLSEPLAHLRNLLMHCAPRSICAFDFRHHGEHRLQHVSPNLVHLADVMKEDGFVEGSSMHRLPIFRRGLPD